MHRREFLKRTTVAIAFGTLSCRYSLVNTRIPPEPTAQKLPRWRGFNLLEKLTLNTNRPYCEQDFEWIAAWGFDFVRLPMDYRCWDKFDESTMREIDQAIAWGQRYGIHVNLNFHRAPGYCVNQPPDQNTLWNNPTLQDEFARHWQFFAKRYCGIPIRHLSFDLVNEPAGIDAGVYVPVIKKAVDAIRAEDPQRLIIADGLQWGRQPVPELIPLGIAQSTRGYEPMLISHYRASWVHGSDQFPTPAWPVPLGINDHLYGSFKPELQSPLVLRVNCPRPTNFSIHICQVSTEAELLVTAGKITVIQQILQPGPAADYSASIPAGTREIRLEVGNGDWLKFTEIRLGDRAIIPTDHDWAIRQDMFIVDTHGTRPVTPRFRFSREVLQKKMIEPWQQLARQGVGIHVGEWGVFNHTSHSVALAWMRDCLTNWKAAGFGWALWNFRGPFGILDSNRKDVKYETFKGHKLDRKMLDLLRRF